jgi:hypothetical protein
MSTESLPNGPDRDALITDPDYAAFDRILPHPVYAKQRWISIVNPSDASVRDALLPLPAEAHDRLATARRRQRCAKDFQEATNA